MSFVVRWKFQDLVDDSEIFLPINPNKASAPTSPRSLTWAAGSRAGLDRLRVFEQPSRPAEWTFGGVIHTKEHYDLLLEWAARLHRIRITDHLGRMFEVLIQRFDPVERIPTATKPWRATYTMTCLLLDEVTP